MNMALATCKAPIDYINPHATATPVGDLGDRGDPRRVRHEVSADLRHR